MQARESSTQKSVEREESVILEIKKPRVVSKAMPVFYNPVMKLNRDVSVLLLKAWDKNNLRIADVLAGTGVRSLRFLKELPSKKISRALVNDASPEAVKRIKQNFKLNKVSQRKASIHSHDASACLLGEKAMDYIDVDPFGSPNPFLDASVKKIRPHGILAITATDTAALAGSAPASCKRKYWAEPLRNECMHELGLRILVRKAQLVGAQYEKALVPVFSHATAHYYRAYLHFAPGAKQVKNVLATHGFVLFCNNCGNRAVSQTRLGVCCKKRMVFAGPLWLGKLWNSALVARMRGLAGKEAKTLLDLIFSEAKTSLVCFYDLHKLCSRLGIGAVRKKQVTKEIRKKGYAVAETHFSARGIRTDAPVSVLKRILLSARQKAR